MGRAATKIALRKHGAPRSPLEIMLELIEGWKFNRFDGEKVAADLRQHRELWDGVVMLSEPGLMLRDIHDERGRSVWHADTLWISARKANLSALKKLVSAWEADMVRWTTESGEYELDRHRGAVARRVDPSARVSNVLWTSRTGSDDMVVFRLWWD